MKLYRSPKHLTRWFAYGPGVGWVMFPAEIGGWYVRQPARGVDPSDLCEIPLRMGFNTGIPGAPVSAAAGGGLMTYLPGRIARHKRGEPKTTCLTCKLKRCTGGCHPQVTEHSPPPAAAYSPAVSPGKRQGAGAGGVT